MDLNLPTMPLENGLKLRDVVTTGSILHINEDYVESEYEGETEKNDIKAVDAIGKPVKSFDVLEKTMTTIDGNGYVKKKIIGKGGGISLHMGCIVSIAFSAYWENDSEPFDVVKVFKPLVVDIKDNGLLPGLQIAIQSMLVGELSIFLFSHKVMYGEMGIPPRIKPKAKCIFYIKLIKSILTPKKGPIDFFEPNMFTRVHHEVKLLYSSGVTLHNENNYTTAIQLFRKGISMLHKCRLADENEEKIQEQLLIKFYTNLAICYNKIKQPLQACTACNELSRLGSLWNNSKALFQNAKALRMIGEYDKAEKKLKRALKISPDTEEIKAELELLKATHTSCNQNRLICKGNSNAKLELVSDYFKQEVDILFRNFKDNTNLCKLILPSGLNSDEIDYIKDLCIRENLFFNKIQKNYLLDKDKIVEDFKDCNLSETLSSLNINEA